MRLVSHDSRMVEMSGCAEPQIDRSSQSSSSDTGTGTLHEACTSALSMPYVRAEISLQQRLLLNELCN